MAIEILIPRLGWSMDEGVFAGWLKRDGDTIRAGDAIFSLEGEKATQDIEAIDEGVLQIPVDAPVAGDTVAVGAIIGYLIQPNETHEIGTTVASQKPLMVPIEVVVPSSSCSGRPRSSPLARRVASEHGIDWTTLKGSGSSGRIRKADVVEAIEAKGRDGQKGRMIPLSPTRRMIADRMVESCLTTAPVTLTTSLDATNLVNLRRQYKAAESQLGSIPSYHDFLIKLTALALPSHPLLNSSLVSDQIVIHDQSNIGMAVDTEAGLVVPVIHNAGELGLRQIVARSRELIDLARARRLRSNDVQGGTFTITSLGTFGIETFTPIINLPQCAILGIGKIEKRPVMEGDKVVGRERMDLSLTFDHRIVDGAPAAKFLQHLVGLIENPAPWLMG